MKDYILTRMTTIYSDSRNCEVCSVLISCTLVRCILIVIELCHTKSASLAAAQFDMGLVATKSGQSETQTCTLSYIDKIEI